MLHADGLKSCGRFFGFVDAEGSLVVKLPAARVTELVGSGTGRPCALGRRKPMREWVRLRPADEAACDAYLREARDFVGAG